MDSGTGHALGGTRVASQSNSLFIVQVGGEPLGGAFRAYEVRAGARTTIGRGTGNDIAFGAEAGEISREHALLDYTSAIITIGDRSSTNGTFVNGERVVGLRRLALGDRIRLGASGPEFRLEATSTIPVTGVPPASDPGGVYERRESTLEGSRVRGSAVLADILPTISPNRSGLVWRALPFAVSITVAVLLLFLTAGIPIVFDLVLGLFIGGAVLAVVSALANRNCPWWLMLAIAIPAPLLILYTNVGKWLEYFFNAVLPGHGSACAEPGNGFFEAILSCTIGVGLFEELMKIVPVIAVAFIALQFPAGSPWRRTLAVKGPLDGIFFGAISGVGFTLYETLRPGGYVSNAIVGSGYTAGLELEIPRLIGSALGHVAWTGYIGYALGLALMRRTPNSYRSLLGAYGIAALLHGIWDATAFGSQSLGLITSNLLEFVIGLSSFMLLIGAIDRAKRLETRAEAARAA